MKKDENKIVDMNQKEAQQEQPKKENIFKRTWKKIPKPVKVIIIGAGAIGGTMVAGRLMNVDRGGDAYDPYGDTPFLDDPNAGTGGNES